MLNLKYTLFINLKSIYLQIGEMEEYPLMGPHEFSKKDPLDPLNSGDDSARYLKFFP